jgi:LPXTG-motif cell wall-anchored protein
VTNPATAVAAGSEAGQDLAFTGMTAAPIAIAALGMAALGGILIFAGRKRQRTRV